MTYHGVNGQSQPEVDCPVYIVTSDDPGIVTKSLNDFSGDDFRLPDDENGFRWFHLPVNDMATVKTLFEKCNYELNSTLKVRPALSKSIRRPLHSRHMEPSCTNSNLPADARQPCLTLYLPYMNWDTYEHYCTLRAYYSEYEQNRPQQTTSAIAYERETIEYMLSHDPLHPRRTLDQFYYSSLADTSTRDADQTISKWTGNQVGPEGRARAENDSLLIMVDQLWYWVLDDKTVISCFPSHDHCPSYSDKFCTLYRSVQRHAHRCTNAWDLTLGIVSEAIVHLFSQENREITDLFEIYKWVTGKKAASQTKSFEEFHQRHSSGTSSSSFLDDRRDLKLVLDIADIIDELKMIEHVVVTQRDIVRNIKFGVPRGVGGSRTEDIDDILGWTDLLLSDIKSIERDAEYAHKMLLELLDLKQKTASLAEARSTTQQGRAVMLFTIVTVIFLPLSFFTSYFGQNVSEITGDDKNPSTWDLWRVGTPISLFVILLALSIAYYITNPSSLPRLWRRIRRILGSVVISLPLKFAQYIRQMFFWKSSRHNRSNDSHV